MPNVDEQKMTAFLAQHQGIVCKIARSFACDGSDYEDLFQEICIGLWAAFEQVPDGVRESTYVYRVALNRAISLRRKRNSYVQHLTSFWRMQSRQLEPQKRRPPSSRTELLYTAIRSLSDSDRSLVLLYLDELSANEMSDILGVQPATLRKRISRVKQKLATIIQGLEENDE